MSLLWCAQWVRSGVWSEPAKNVLKMLQGRLCFTHLLPLCFSLSHTLDMVSHFPISLFSASRSLPPSVWRSSLPSPSVSQCTTHRDGGRQGGGDAKKSIKRRKTRMIYSTCFHWHFYTLSGHVLGLPEISTEISHIHTIHTFMFYSTEMSYLWQSKLFRTDLLYVLEKLKEWFYVFENTPSFLYKNNTTLVPIHYIWSY